VDHRFEKYADSDGLEQAGGQPQAGDGACDASVGCAI
jgi:hypothetical protein